MPRELSESLLRDALATTLEDAAFLLVEPAETAADTRDGIAEAPLVEATIRYMGAHEGELRLVVSEALAAMLAADMLGEPAGGAAARHAEDAVAELLNMAAGAIAVELFGAGAHCGLGLPSVRRIGAESHAAALRSADAAVRLQDELGRPIDLSGRRVHEAPR